MTGRQCCFCKPNWKRGAGYGICPIARNGNGSEDSSGDGPPKTKTGWLRQLLRADQRGITLVHTVIGIVAVRDASLRTGESIDYLRRMYPCQIHAPHHPNKRAYRIQALHSALVVGLPGGSNSQGARESQPVVRHRNSSVFV